MKAQHRSSPEGRAAFAKLCEKYWYPLYAHARRVSGDADRAQDLTQGFFERVIAKNYIADADPDRGRFRTFLLTSLSNYMANECDKSRAMKRGGGRLQFSLDFANADRRYKLEPIDETTPEKAFQRRWAITLLSRVLRSLRDEFVADGKDELFDQLKQFLTPGTNPKQAEVAQRLEMSEGALKVAVHRLKKAYHDRLFNEIAATTADRSEIDDEIRQLFDAFSR